MSDSKTDWQAPIKAARQYSLLQRLIEISELVPVSCRTYGGKNSKHKKRYTSLEKLVLAVAQLCKIDVLSEACMCDESEAHDTYKLHEIIANCCRKLDFLICCQETLSDSLFEGKVTAEDHEHNDPNFRLLGPRQQCFRRLLLNVTVATSKVAAATRKQVANSVLKGGGKQ